MAKIFSGLLKKAKRNSLKKDYARDYQNTSFKQQVLCFDSCELPLWNFVQVVTKGELSPLIIEGNPSDEQLIAAWDSIFTEYCDIMASKGQTYVLHIQREIKHIESKLTIMQLCIDRLQISYYEPAIEVLKEYGFDYPYTPESMFEDLTNTIAEAQYLIVQKEVKQAEYQKYLEGQKGEIASEQDYIDILSTLSKHQGYPLRIKDLSVREYVSIFNQYKKENGG